MPTFTAKQITGALIIIGLLLCIPLFSMCMIHVDAGEICIVQYPSGTLKVYAQPGYQWRFFGDYKRYKKSFQFWFSAKGDQGKAGDESIKCRFNEGGHAQISGSVRIDLPTDDKSMIAIHTKYGNQFAVEHEMVRTCIEKSVYMSGPLMSSQESSAEKRPLLLTYIEDQASNGVYDNKVHDQKVPDPITGEMKTISVVEILTDTKGVPLRTEDSPLKQFSVKMYALSINEVKYDDNVEAQIQKQQKAKMDVQIAIAQAKTAEQDALTAEKKGQAAAAVAKWEQEVEKAKEVTKAEKEQQVAKIAAEKEATVAKIAAERDLAVATLAKQAADQTKMKDIALGEGESTRMKLVMAANGALEQKLKTYSEVNSIYAKALGDFRGNLVPTVVMSGGSGQGGQTSALNLIDLLMAKTAKDLSLDFTMKAQDAEPVAPAVPAKK